MYFRGQDHKIPASSSERKPTLNDFLGQPTAGRSRGSIVNIRRIKRFIPIATA